MEKKTPYFLMAFHNRQFSSLSFLCCRVKSSKIRNKGCTDFFLPEISVKIHIERTWNEDLRDEGSTSYKELASIIEDEVRY